MRLSIPFSVHVNCKPENRLQGKIWNNAYILNKKRKEMKNEERKKKEGRRNKKKKEIKERADAMLLISSFNISYLK